MLFFVFARRRSDGFFKHGGKITRIRKADGICDFRNGEVGAFEQHLRVFYSHQVYIVAQRHIDLAVKLAAHICAAHRKRPANVARGDGKRIVSVDKIESEDSSGTSSNILVSDNHERIVCHSVGKNVKKIKFVPLKTNGAPEFRLFSFELK